MTESGVFSSCDTFAIKSERSVSTPESSDAIVLKQFIISSNPSEAPFDAAGLILAEKSPRISLRAASTTARTGLSTMILRRKTSTPVQISARNIAFPNVASAAANRFSRVNTTPDASAK